jgi:hypothetical protein
MRMRRGGGGGEHVAARRGGGGLYSEGAVPRRVWCGRSPENGGGVWLISARRPGQAQQQASRTIGGAAASPEPTCQ